MRTITKLQTLLVLFLTTAMIGFAGCKDDDGDVPGPTPGNEATYAISGKVTDVDGAAMADVNVALSGAKSMSAKTAADGQYTFDLGKNAAGAYKVTFSKEGYIERSYDITVKKVESGLGENIQNAVMEKGTTPEPTPEYKKAKYFLTVSVKDEAGKDITASDLSVLVKLGDKEIAKENKASFELSDVATGTYDITATASGYEKTVAKVVVSPVEDQEKAEGDGDTFDVKYPANLVLKASTPTPTGPSYIVEGDVKDVNGKAVNATITLSGALTKMIYRSGFETQTVTGSHYRFVIPQDAVTAQMRFTIRVVAEGYAAYSYNFTLDELKPGETANVIADFHLTPATPTPDPDPTPGVDPTPDVPKTEGGSVSTDITKPDTSTGVEQVGKVEEKIEANQEKKVEVKDETGKTVEVAVKIPEAVADKYESGANVAVANPTKLAESLGEIKSVVEDVNEIDEISFSTEGSNTGVVIVTPNNTTEDFSIKRNPEVEQTLNKVAKEVSEQTNTDASAIASTGSPAAAVTRIYTGKPDGTVIIPAMEIKAPVPADFKEVTDMPLNLLYKNEENNTWVIENGVEVKAEGGKLTIPVAHYSQFSAGLLMAVKPVKVDDTTITIEKSAFGEYNTTVDVEVPFNDVYKDGKDLDKAVSAVVYGSASKAYLKSRLQNKIDANGGVHQVNKTYEVKVDEGATLKAVEVQLQYEAKEYVIYYLDKSQSLQSVSVTVQRAKSALLLPIYEQSHGHGHGNGNNAGGGIFGK
ncbi:carboxypeptidase-like regulatory domain-containing protein [Parabacteroides distasonis]|uniref:carboxypeptidase-like regulatory domain-containing protein n=1 Tax=Parabacteroides distasonis TaxID=823 RepID=UPI001C3810A8|nr:carboxypeptidase-like regulatory domain-containing protein [Parabacteroides distasonis]MBV4224707.1 carboxypeptidase-like regulatory domain-containing protein [Parabacteroides distasonis]